MKNTKKMTDKNGLVSKINILKINQNKLNGKKNTKNCLTPRQTHIKKNIINTNSNNKIKVNIISNNEENKIIIILFPTKIKIIEKVNQEIK